MMVLGISDRPWPLFFLGLRSGSSICGCAAPSDAGEETASTRAADPVDGAAPHVGARSAWGAFPPIGAAGPPVTEIVYRSLSPSPSILVNTIWSPSGATAG